MNIQGWSSLGLVSLISLLSKGLSRVYPFLQDKPEFCNKDLVTWATVSTRSCSCWCIELLHLWSQKRESIWFWCWPSGDTHCRVISCVQYKHQCYWPDFYNYNVDKRIPSFKNIHPKMFKEKRDIKPMIFNWEIRREKTNLKEYPKQLFCVKLCSPKLIDPFDVEKIKYMYTLKTDNKIHSYEFYL